MGVVTSRDPF